jgi:hypothetical protein
MESMTKGICRLAMVPVRAEASDKSEMVSQLLFGEHYAVVENNAKWLKISIAYDGYEGWLDTRQHTNISDEYYHHLNSTEFKIATDLLSTILYKKERIPILIGSILPISSHELFEVNEQFAFDGSSKNLGSKKDFSYLMEAAESYMNAPYLWGGRTPFGIDCSGLVQQLYRLCGYSLPRDARMQYFQGEKVTSVEASKAGDLAFFQNDSGDIIHVGIIWEKGQILHASGRVKTNKLDENGIYNDEVSGYSHNIAGIRRIFRP